MSVNKLRLNPDKMDVGVVGPDPALGSGNPLGVAAHVHDLGRGGGFPRTGAAPGHAAGGSGLQHLSLAPTGSPIATHLGEEGPYYCYTCTSYT